MKSTFTRQWSITQFNLSSRSYQRLSDPFLPTPGWVVKERRKIIIIKLLSCNVDLMTQNMMQLSDPSEWINWRCAGRRPAPGDQPFWPTSFTALDRQPGAFLLMPLLPTLKNVSQHVWKKCDVARIKEKFKLSVFAKTFTVKGFHLFYSLYLRTCLRDSFIQIFIVFCLSENFTNIWIKRGF